MDVLLLGSDSAAGLALQSTLARWGRHQALPLTMAASRWSTERQAKKAARRGRPAVIVDCRIAAVLSEHPDFPAARSARGRKQHPDESGAESAGDQSSGESGAPDYRSGVLTEADLERAHWLAKACEHSGMRYLCLSSDRVFSGSTGRGLRETDETDATDPVGMHLAETERRVLQAAPSSLILRTGPIFAASTPGLLSRTLEIMTAQAEAVFDDRAVFCPVPSHDLARVVSAILDQMSAGAAESGLFHYCSGDRTTEYGFAEVSLAAASQYIDCGDVALRPATATTEAATVQHVLDCSRLRDAFAIKQTPWRGAINELVKQYLDARAAA